MAKLTIEIDLEDPQETWDALYRRIEEFGEHPEQSTPAEKPAPVPSTYDLLLDPDQHFGDISDFFAVFSGRQDESN